MGDAWLLAWSAPDEPAEARLRRHIEARLCGEHPWAVAEVVRELDGQHRADDPVRGAAVLTGTSAREVRAALQRPARRVDERAPRPVAVLFDGHGAQHPAMATGLYGVEPVFTRSMDELFDAIGPEGARLRTLWLSGAPVDDAEFGQPLLLGVGHALACTLRSWGVRPEALLGHSIGEVAASVVAGVLDIGDAARLMAARTLSYRFAAPGGLLAVAASVAELEPFLVGDVCVGVVNGPRQTMLAGPEPELSQVADRVRATGRTCLPARIPLPFHSPVLAPLAAISEAALAKLTLRPPSVDVYSTATAAKLTPEQAVDPGFLAAQVCKPVLFAPALDALLHDRDVLLVEAGPGRALITLARKHPRVADGHSATTAMLPRGPGVAGGDRGALLDAAATLWLEGHRLDLTAVQRTSTTGWAASTARGNAGAVPRVGDMSAATQ